MRALLLSLLLMGCASTPPPVIVVSSCNPPNDLPRHVEIVPLPEEQTFLDRLFVLFVQDRADHAKLANQYNSLYDHVAEHCQ